MLLPIILPMKDAREHIISELYRVVYYNNLNVYYSYQHPIAFYCRGRFAIRDGFWNRRRARRAVHVAHILADVERQLGREIGQDYVTLTTNDFLIALEDEARACGFVFPVAVNQPGVSVSKTDNKRRVKL